MEKPLEDILEEFADLLMTRYEGYSLEELLKEQWSLMQGLQDETLDPCIRALYDYTQTVLALVYTKENEPEKIH